jgi:hypothetical protein
MEMSGSITELSAALAAAQTELNNPAFDSKNPHFKSSYASLASVRNTVVPVLAKHGLSVIQDVSAVENGVVCVQMLLHKSGQWIRTAGLKVPFDKANAHGYGSATTYARRFSLMALVCVVGDDDDDGNAVSMQQIQRTEKKVEPDLAWIAKIDEASTLDALASVWTAMPKQQQELLKRLKDKKKKELTAE